jgi:prepilin-type N-terminal cleavage/methylation domain-containing protein/prepilin-type processing-associated H-X9-DG protein
MTRSSDDSLRIVVKPNSRRQRGSFLQQSGGFTFVELLTVIAIIAILASLVSAALNNTEGKANHITCLNNLRQLQMSWLLYVDENEDKLPLNRSIPGPPNLPQLGNRNTTNSWVAGNPKEDLTTENIERGTLFPYTRSPLLYRCPQDKSTVLSNNRVQRTRSYSMSAYMNGDAEGLDPRVKSRSSEIINPPPTHVFVLIEEHENSKWIGSFAVLPKDEFPGSPDVWISTPSDRHRQGCNLAFADGRVEYWKWFAPKKAPLTRGGNSHEPWDIKRLQKAIPNQTR